MKTKKLFFYLLAGILTGCVPSLHPLYTNKDLVFEEKLLGTWSNDSDHKQIFEFARAGNDPNGREYTMVYTDGGGKKGEFRAKLGKLNGTMFLDLFPGKLECQTSEFYNLHFLPAHTFMKIEQIEPVLKMATMKSDKMEEMLKDDPNLIKFEDLEEREFVLTASTEELQEFMKKHANDEDLFDSIGDLKRVVPKVSEEPNSIDPNHTSKENQ
jgi:hypothetical protein